MDGLLAGKLAVVQAAASPAGNAVCGALRNAGAVVEPLAPGHAPATSWQAFATVDVYVHCGPWADVGAPSPFAALEDAAFAAAFERPVLDLIASLRAGYTHLAKPGGRVVVVVPTAGMAGAPGLAATAAAAEAQRQLAKSVARQWGSEGLSVNVVAADLAALAPGIAGLPAVSLSPPALGTGAVADLGAIGRLVAVLASGEASALTGATLSADGGVWMAP
jgi:3-oxoacyl-[acyl-carrier protein] reductase